MPRRSTLSFTPAQLLMVNSALARWEADDHDDDPNYHQGVMNGARLVVFDVMADLGLLTEPADDGPDRSAEQAEWEARVDRQH